MSFSTTVKYQDTSNTLTTSGVHNNSSNSNQFNVTYSGTATTTTSGPSGPCNESKVHNNDEKAIFHGMKNAFRMSREYDGKEYGSDDPQYEHAAHAAAHTALAYLKANDVEYDREASFDYLDQNVLQDDSGVLDTLLGVFRGESEAPADGGAVTDDELAAGIARAWKQIDKKQHHDDGARTALAIAEAYLNTKFAV